MEVLTHRIVWSFVVLALLKIAWQGDALRMIRSLKRSVVGLYALAGVLIAINWLIYIWAVNAGFIVETSLGYFIAPLVNVLLGVLVFRERLRVVEPMNEMTKGLKDAELRAMAERIAKLPPPRPLADTPDPGRMERARAIVEQQRCNFCHNRDYSGAQNVPRLAGQREDYLALAMRGYKSNARRGYDASMADVLNGVSDDQIADLAYFLAHQR